MYEAIKKLSPSWATLEFWYKLYAMILAKSIFRSLMTISPSRGTYYRLTWSVSAIPHN